MSLFADLRRLNLDLIKEICQNIDIIHKASFRVKVEMLTAVTQITEQNNEGKWNRTEDKYEYIR